MFLPVKDYSKIWVIKLMQYQHSNHMIFFFFFWWTEDRRISRKNFNGSEKKVLMYTKQRSKNFYVYASDKLKYFTEAFTWMWRRKPPY